MSVLWWTYHTVACTALPFPTLHSVTSQRQPETSRGGGVHTMEMGQPCRAGLSRPSTPGEPVVTHLPAHHRRNPGVCSRAGANLPRRYPFGFPLWAWICTDGCHDPSLSPGLQDSQTSLPSRQKFSFSSVNNTQFPPVLGLNKDQCLANSLSKFHKTIL